jgi:RNA polymerase sigma-70 factor (ECF subfamily)
MQDIDSHLRHIIDRFSSLIRHVIASNLHKTDEINLEDVEQEVKVKIWKFLKKGKKVDNFPSYIKRVAYTATIDELRKMRKQNPSSVAADLKNIYSMDRINELRNPEDSPGLRLEEHEMRESLKALIDSLGENRKQVLRLYLIGMSIEEICEFFSWDKTKVRHFLYRGIDDLKEKMKSHQENKETSPLDNLTQRKKTHNS